tara:strand:- start:41 stop:295 length:255 start_codon:yes stop_codon:yes gene_type:complete
MGSTIKRPRVLSLTQAAADRIQELLEASDKPVTGLRVGIKNTGCSGMSYSMDYAQEPEPHDEVVEDKGVKLYIEAKSIMFLIGT